MMNLSWASAGVPDVLAQSEFDWKSLLYVLIVLVLPLLSSLGAWLRKRSGKQPGGPVSDFEDISEDEIILLPEEPVRRPPVPRARPVLPARPVVVVSPVAPPVRPAAEPVAPWVPGRTPRIFVPPPVPASGPLAGRGTSRLRGEARREAARAHAAPGPTVSRARVELGVLTPGDLRRAILLREVLGPPVALRPPGEAPWER